MVVLRTKRFILRPYKKGDETSLQKNINDKDIYRYTTRIPYPYTKKDAQTWVSAKNSKSKYNFAIAINGKVVGGIRLEKIGKPEGQIGYWLGRKYWNKGIMTEAVKRITKFGFFDLKLTLIKAGVFAGNKASIRVLEKAGYKKANILPGFKIKDNKLHRAIWYAKKNINGQK